MYNSNTATGITRLICIIYLIVILALLYEYFNTHTSYYMNRNTYSILFTHC